MTGLLHSRYRLVEVLGSGAMGVVWRAEDTVLEREIALKELVAIPGVDPAEANERFLVEARAAARLSHPNIVSVHDVFSDGERVRIAMELVAGPTLAEVVRVSGPQPPETVRAVMAQVAQALAAAHRAGVVHRDLKPENVFWTEEGRAVVADFGLARIGAGRGTVEGTIMGTPGYMAPEQVKGVVAGPPADVFGWAAVAYELVTGAAPFGEPSVTDPGALAYRIVHEPPGPLDIPADPALAALIAKALSKNPADRPQDGAALVAAMAVPASAPSPTAGQPPGPVDASALSIDAAAQIAGPAVSVAAVLAPAVSASPVSGAAVSSPAQPAPPAEVAVADMVASVGVALSDIAAASPTRKQKRQHRDPRDRPPSGAVFLIPVLLLLLLIVLVAFNGTGVPKPQGTIQAGAVTINDVDPYAVKEVIVDLTRPINVAGKVEPGFLRKVRLEFSALGIPLGSSSFVPRGGEGDFKVRIDAGDAAKFFVGGRVTGKLTLYGPEDDSGVPAKQTVTFPMKSTQSAMRTVPAGVAAIMILFLLAYVKSSLYWLIYGERKGFETTNLIIGGGFVGVAAMLLAWLFGGPEPTMRVFVTCVVLGMLFGVATAICALRFSQRREAKRKKSEQADA